MRKIFVTGGAGGLGMAIVRKHLSLGDRVWAADVKSNREMERLAAEEGRLTFLLCDVASTESVRETLLPLLDEIGRLDFLYSCAGVYDFADKVQLVGGDSAYTVPSRLKTRLVVVDGVKFALETKKSKGFMLIVK